MKSIKKYASGITLTFILAYIGILFSSFIPYHLISGSVFALLTGMILNPYISEFGFFKPGINFVSKQIKDILCIATVIFEAFLSLEYCSLLFIILNSVFVA